MCTRYLPRYKRSRASLSAVLSIFKTVIINLALVHFIYELPLTEATMVSKQLFLLEALASFAWATDLLVPLYASPTLWGPVETAVASNPGLTAKIIINPSSGPGDFPPRQDYLDHAKTLSANKNVQLIGYIHTSDDGGATRCQKPIDDLKADIRKWANWNTISGAGISMHGIFIDEAPFDGNNNCTAYMQDLTSFIKEDASLTFSSPRVVVFNPGTPGTGALKPYFSQTPPPDIIVALETCFTIPSKAITGDACPPSGGYEVYDNEGFGGSIDKYFPFDIGTENYGRAGIIVHGFHDTNGPEANFVADQPTLLAEIKAVVKKGIGAAFFNTMEYNSFDTGPADIGSVAADLTTANANPNKRRFVA